MIIFSFGHRCVQGPGEEEEQKKNFPDGRATAAILAPVGELIHYHLLPKCTTTESTKWHIKIHKYSGVINQRTKSPNQPTGAKVASHWRPTVVHGRWCVSHVWVQAAHQCIIGYLHRPLKYGSSSVNLHYSTEHLTAAFITVFRFSNIYDSLYCMHAARQSFVSFENGTVICQAFVDNLMSMAAFLRSERSLSIP